ncbi:MAG: hypothetical protein QXX79_02830 [Candidatus Bathyarchaeia archaeon]
MDDFDKLLIQAIDKVMKYSLGEVNTMIIYEYFEKRSCPITDIPKNLEFFSMEMRRLLGSGRGQILGAAPILEKTILKSLCQKLGISCEIAGPVNFAEYVRKLKESYNHGKNEAH